jgi:hypothetical protein
MTIDVDELEAALFDWATQTYWKANRKAPMVTSQTDPLTGVIEFSGKLAGNLASGEWFKNFFRTLRCIISFRIMTTINRRLICLLQILLLKRMRR